MKFVYQSRKKQRVLVTTLTKRMAEDWADYLSNLNIKVAYIHSTLIRLKGRNNKGFENW